MTPRYGLTPAQQRTDAKVQSEYNASTARLRAIQKLNEKAKKRAEAKMSDLKTLNNLEARAKIVTLQSRARTINFAGKPGLVGKLKKRRLDKKRMKEAGKMITSVDNLTPAEAKALGLKPRKLKNRGQRGTDEATTARGKIMGTLDGSRAREANRKNYDAISDYQKSAKLDEKNPAIHSANSPYKSVVRYEDGPNKGATYSHAVSEETHKKGQKVLSTHKKAKRAERARDISRGVAIGAPLAAGAAIGAPLAYQAGKKKNSNNKKGNEKRQRRS